MPRTVSIVIVCRIHISVALALVVAVPLAAQVPKPVFLGLKVEEKELAVPQADGYKIRFTAKASTRSGDPPLIEWTLGAAIVNTEGRTVDEWKSETPVAFGPLVREIVVAHGQTMILVGSYNTLSMLRVQDGSLRFIGKGERGTGYVNYRQVSNGDIEITTISSIPSLPMVMRWDGNEIQEDWDAEALRVQGVFAEALEDLNKPEDSLFPPHWTDVCNYVLNAAYYLVVGQASRGKNGDSHATDRALEICAAARKRIARWEHPAWSGLQSTAERDRQNALETFDSSAYISGRLWIKQEQWEAYMKLIAN
jgi:hypothetical protein